MNEELVLQHLGFIAINEIQLEIKESNAALRQRHDLRFLNFKGWGVHPRFHAKSGPVKSPLSTSS